MNQRRGLDVDQSIISLHETGSLDLGIVEFAKQYCDLENLARCEIHRAIIKQL